MKTSPQLITSNFFGPKILLSLFSLLHPFWSDRHLQKCLALKGKVMNTVCSVVDFIGLELLFKDFSDFDYYEFLKAGRGTEQMRESQVNKLPPL